MPDLCRKSPPDHSRFSTILLRLQQWYPHLHQKYRHVDKAIQNRPLLLRSYQEQHLSFLYQSPLLSSRKFHSRSVQDLYRKSRRYHLLRKTIPRDCFPLSHLLLLPVFHPHTCAIRQQSPKFHPTSPPSRSLHATSLQDLLH